MSKKRKRKTTATKAPANGAHDEPSEAGATVELSESQPTRTGDALTEGDKDADAAAIAELDEDQPTRNAAQPLLRSVGAPEMGASHDDDQPTRAYEDRFDFGDERARAQAAAATAAEADAMPRPPDPGTADAASPRLQSIVESLLFAAERPLNLRQLADLVEEPEVERIRSAVLAVEQSWRERGVQLHEVAGGFQFRTHPANAIWVQKLLQQKPVRLSRALLETLAIVSYRQPITRPEIDEIRGVDSGGTLKTLMDRVLVRILGKKEEPGRPLLYGTTKEFLEFFSLRDLKDLPTLREYHELSEEHRAQVAALEGAAPEGAILPEGVVDEDEGVGDLPDVLPKLSRLEIAAPKEDAAELAEIDRLIRNAGASIATDSDLPSGEPSEDIVITGKFDGARVRAAREGEAVPDREFDEERMRTGTFGEPLVSAEAIEAIDKEARAGGGDFDNEERTRLRPTGLDASLVDGRDPDKEPTP